MKSMEILVRDKYNSSVILKTNKLLSELVDCSVWDSVNHSLTYLVNDSLDVSSGNPITDSIFKQIKYGRNK